ncbi:MAG: TlpA disulfide reductase family protein [Bacteroidales bacterium]
MNNIHHTYAQDNTTPHTHKTYCTLTGEAPEYADTSIIMYQYTDYLTKTETILDTLHLDSTGYFSCTFPLQHTQEIYMYLGIYTCFLFAEPDSTHTITLPPHTPKTIQDDINPYFKYFNISIGIKKPASHDLNLLIYKFNRLYEKFLADNYHYLLVSRDKKVVKEFESRIDSIFAKYTHPYFKTYLQFKIYILRNMGYERNHKLATKNYLLPTTPSYYNEAYMRFFKMLWKDYIVNNHMTTIGEDIKQSIIFGKSPTMFKRRMEKYIELRNDTIKELILLQCLQDSYKKPDIFPVNTVNQTLDSLIILSKIPEHKTIAKQIKINQTVKQSRNNIADFTFYTADSLPIKLSHYKGKHIYLGFCRSENLECIANYKILQKIYEETNEHLEIITICYEQDFKTFKTFVKKNKKNYKWTFVYGKNNSEIATYYSVTAMPSYILINPDGSITHKNAPHPTDNFQQRFVDIYKKWKAQEKRKQKQQQLQREW